MNDAQKRLFLTMRLVEKEAHYLRDVAERLFVPDQIDPEWIETLVQTPEGRDRLEAFVGKFARMQDTMIDKLLPHFLTALGEKTGSALDNLNRAERLQMLSNAELWLAMRQLRNRLVHEYVEDMADFAVALTLAREMTTTLLASWSVLQALAKEKFPVVDK